MNQTVVNVLREKRIAAGLSQATLANRTQVTRQTINSIEAGKYAPGTELSLRLAAVLGCRVDDIFRLSDVLRHVDWVSREPLSTGDRVVLGLVADRLVGHRLAGSRIAPDAFVAADAHVTNQELSILIADEQVSRTLFIAGCDPSLSILATFVARKSPEHRVVPLHSPSEGALGELSEGLVHVAGSHLPGAGGSDPNISHAGRALTNRGGIVVSYATWEQGMVVAPGNPRRIRAISDLARRDVRIVNRDRGSGARRFLDDGLAAAPLAPADVQGYDTEVYTHMGVARSVQAGVADAGIALRAVASAFGLDFVPLGEICFDLVIPAEHLDHPTVRIVLDVLQSGKFRADLAALPGYEVSRTGATLLELKAA